MKLSKLATDIAESPTLALNEEARWLRERGEAVIHLGIGEPKNKTPINAILTSAARLTSGEVKYAPVGVAEITSPFDMKTPRRASAQYGCAHRVRAPLGTRGNRGALGPAERDGRGS